MKFPSTLAALAAWVALAGGLNAADELQDDKPAFAALCPISGTPALQENVHDYQGKKLYTCCPNCIKFLLRHQEDYAAQVHHQWLQTSQITQVACPLTGRLVNNKKLAKVSGVKLPVCCDKCLAKIEGIEDPEGQINLVFAKLDRGFTLQTECPVSGRAIDSQQALEHDGKQVYFCCSNCPATFDGDPEKYLAKLPQFRQSAEKKE